MERFFNTAGPSEPEDHYCLSPLDRINLPEIINLIEQRRYFILHAPRQTGKTTCLLTLMKYLNRGERSIANQIYQEVIPRQLTYSTQFTISHKPAWYSNAAGAIDMNKLVAAFQELSP